MAGTLQKEASQYCAVESCTQFESNRTQNESKSLIFNDTEQVSACVPGGKRELSVAEQRKRTPIFSGVLAYFPLAMAEIARVSYAGSKQHHPDAPMHWDKDKSSDEADALVRHLLDHGKFDTDGQRHTAKVAWRGLALLERELEAERDKAKESAR